MYFNRKNSKQNLSFQYVDNNGRFNLCSSKGKRFISISHPLRNVAVGTQKTLPR